MLCICVVWLCFKAPCKFFVATHVLVITSRKEVGSYVGFPVFRVMSMKFLSCNEAMRLPNHQEVIFSSCFFFSSEFLKREFMNHHLNGQKSHHHRQPNEKFFCAEKGWGLLQDLIKSNRINSGFVLFVRDRYNLEVCNFYHKSALCAVLQIISSLSLYYLLSCVWKMFTACREDSSWLKGEWVNQFGSRFVCLVVFSTSFIYF